MWHCTQILWHWEFRIIDAIVLLYVRFNVCGTIVFAIIGIVHQRYSS
jgi:hypothetical protein